MTKKKKIEYHYPVFTCLNCDNEISVNRQVKIYCSDLCKQIAYYIRYVRRCKRNGRIKKQDVQDAIKIIRAHILSGGYPESERHIPRSIREKVLLRDKRICQICGNPGNEIDHIDGSSNDLCNLQTLCKMCHIEKTKEMLVPVTPKDKKYLDLFLINYPLDVRIEAKEPLRKCDDEINWENKYREIKYERRMIFFQSVKPIITELKKRGYNQKRIAEEINNVGIPTISGHGKWVNHSIGDIIRLYNL